MTTQELTPKEKQEVAESAQTRPGRYYAPDVDIREDENSLWLWADMPGVKQDSITVDLDKGTLTIRGDLDLSGYEGLTPVYTEYNVGSFARASRSRQARLSMSRRCRLGSPEGC